MIRVAAGAVALLLQVVSFASPVNALAYRDFSVRALPFVYAHDSATGYVVVDDSNRLLAAYGKTQTGSLAQQLDCGARALDLRPRLRAGGDLEFHHGRLEVPYLVRDALDELNAWARAANNADELVLLIFKVCAGEDLPPTRKDPGCTRATREELVRAGFRDEQIIEDCAAFSRMTVGQLLDAGRVSGASGAGAALVAVVGERFDACVEQNFNSETEGIVCHDGGVSCIDSDPRDQPSQYNPSPDQLLSAPGQALFDHVLSVTNGPFAPQNSIKPLITANAYFQVNAGSAVAGLTRGSDLLADENAFRLNARSACWLGDGQFPRPNMFQMDAVCNGGTLVREQLYRNAQVEGLDLPDTGVTLECSPPNIVVGGPPTVSIPRSAPPTRGTAATLTTSWSFTVLSISCLLVSL